MGFGTKGKLTKTVILMYSKYCDYVGSYTDIQLLEPLGVAVSDIFIDILNAS